MTSPQDEAGTAIPIKAVPVRHPWRWVVGAIIAVFAAMLVHTLAFSTLGGKSRWQWGVIGHYLFATPILHGVERTILLTVLAMLIGVVLGTSLAVMRLSPNPIVSGASALYIWFFRGTPVLLQIFFWYYIAAIYPKLSIGIPFGPGFVHIDMTNFIGKLTAALLGLGLNEAAYMAEIVRAGIISVDEGQTEAAAALGMRRIMIMRRIVLPQAMRVIIPPTGNETISMLKTTSLAFTIAYTELLYSAQLIYANNYKTIPLLVVAALWYLAITSVLYVGQYFLERRYGRGTVFGQPNETALRRFWRMVSRPPSHISAAPLSTGSEHEP
ncbi:MAG TPA: amino acid ABC transporter permease [Mycobacteriales bacterium]|nr:amino acid ABC transporter permease [Mycobacteriales bacterium]